jgi:hypothetical protein
MRAAFPATRLANLGTNSADVIHESGTARHEQCCKNADRRTIPAEPDVIGHHLDVCLVQTCFSAMFAFLGTFQTCLDARMVLLMRHRILSFEQGQIAPRNELCKPRLKRDTGTEGECLMGPAPNPGKTPAEPFRLAAYIPKHLPAITGRLAPGR